MRRTASFFFAIVLAAGAPAAAQQEPSGRFALGPDLSGYQRFLVYPHLQKGLELMERGDRARALGEFERAREIAPGNARVALYLADAYRKAGDPRRAEQVLRTQLTRTPQDGRIAEALNALKPAAAPAAVIASAPKPPAPAVAPPVDRPAPIAAARAPRRPPTVRPAPSSSEPTGAMVDELQVRFEESLARHDYEAVSHAARALVAREGQSVAALEEISFRLFQGGAFDPAARLLLSAYPFTAAPEAYRVRLLDRLSLAILEQPEAYTPVDLALVRVPLESPALRSRQGAFWTAMNDCAAVRAVLGDMSSDYSYDDLLRLGDCEEARPADQLRAYSAAHALRPGGAASRELGYRAHAAGDYRTALDAWKSVSPSELSNEQRIAAAMSGLAAGDVPRAQSWLDAYRQENGTLDYRYWSLAANVRESANDQAGAVDALEHATTLQPEATDYVRLARLTREPERQIEWLERAVMRDGTHPDARLELAYAYLRAGRADDARNTLKEAATVRPEDMRVQLELGYALWRNGETAPAAAALQNAWNADHANMAAARQLVYINQRLARNKSARFFAERVLDSLPPTDDLGTAEGRENADRRFGLQRLHEDLGRRLTVNLDGFSGTRVGAGTTGDGGSPYRSYSQLEFDYRLGSQSVRNGKTISAYARVLADGGAALSASPTYNPRLGVGLRWKPFGSQVLYVAAEHQRSVEDDTYRDNLLRVSASFLNGGRHGDDWHAAGKGWAAYNLYVDLAHYLKAEQTAATADFRTSLHLKLGSRQTFEPYAHVQTSGVRTAQTDRDVRIGAGTRWNLWHGRSRYDADPHKLSLGVEFQRALDTYLLDRSGVFVTLGSRW